MSRCRGLQIAQALGLVPLLLQALVGIAWLYFRHGNLPRSIELLGLVAQHPALPAEVRIMRVQPLRRELEGILGATVLDQIPETGRMQIL